MEEKEFSLIPIGTEVSAKFKGAFCEAKIGKADKAIKCWISLDGDHSPIVVSDDNVRGTLKVGEKVEARTFPSKPYKRGTITKIVDHTIYTVVFNDGDQRSLKRSQLCIKGDKHFTEGESLDSMPLVHPEEFGSPVVSGRRDRDDSWIGKLVCIDIELKPNGHSFLCPCLVVAVDNQGHRAKKDQLIVRSFMDNKFMNVQRKEAKSFRINDSQNQTQDNSSQSSEETPAVPVTAKGRQLKNSWKDSAEEVKQPKALLKAFERASCFWENDVLPDGWNRTQLLDVCEDEPPSKHHRTSTRGAPSDDDDSSSSSSSLSSFESSDDEGQPNEERDRFVAQLYRFMDERGTPLNKAPSLANKDLDLYRLYNIVQKYGGFNRVNRSDKWLAISKRMKIPHSQTARSQILRAYKKYLQPFEEFYRKLGSSTMSTVDVWGRTRHASRAFISPREKSQSRSESRLNNSNSSIGGGGANLNSSTSAAPVGSSQSNSANKQQTHQQTASSSKSPSSSQPSGSTTAVEGPSSKQQTPMASTPLATPGLPSRRSSGIGGQSDHTASDKTTSNVKPAATNRNRTRRESQSKDTTESSEPAMTQRNRRSATGHEGKRGGARGGPGRGPPAHRQESDGDAEFSDQDVAQNDDNASAHSGDDSSSTEFGKSLPSAVAAAVGLSPSASTPLPLDTTVKVKCGRGTNIHSYEGKITAKRREPDGDYRYHVHYRGWNQRYDEWIVAGRIDRIIRIGDEGSCEHQSVGSPANVNSSRASSMPNSVVSASESDLAGSNDEQRHTVGDTAPAAGVNSKQRQEGSPDKEATSSGHSASPENNGDVYASKPSNSSFAGPSRKRKADDQNKQTASEKINANNGKDKDSSSESCTVEKQPKNTSSNVTTRSTRGKPGDDLVILPSNGARGARRGGYRGHVLKGTGNVTVKTEDLVADVSDANSEKVINKLSQQGSAANQAASAAIMASKSPSKIAAEQQRRLSRPNKFKFNLEEVEKYDNRDERIAFITAKIAEIRSLYSDLKSKVADIDKKRRLYRAYLSSNKNHPIMTGSTTVTIKQQSQNDCTMATFTQSLTVSSEATTVTEKEVLASVKTRP